MADLLALTGTVVKTATSLLELASNIKNAELQNKLAEMNVQLATIQNETALLLKENGKLKEELDNIKNDKANPLSFNSDDGLYYDSESNVPYCPNCYEGEKRERRHLKIGTKKCPNCHEYFAEKAVAVGVAHPVNQRKEHW